MGARGPDRKLQRPYPNEERASGRNALTDGDPRMQEGTGSLETPGVRARLGGMGAGVKRFGACGDITEVIETERECSQVHRSGMDNWDEIRTAYHVARAGTVSGAAAEMGVHHATVIRHVDALEARLGTKLFQRHARGYTPTEAGLDLLQVARATDEQFAQLANRIKGQGETVSGELVVTSLTSFSPFLTPVLTRFQKLHPDLIVRYLTGSRLFRLEYGEAHVAIRAGAPPEQPDNVVQKFATEKIALYASRDYLGEMGMPASEEELTRHRFVAYDMKDTRAPFDRWLRAHLPESAITFRVSDNRALLDAVLAGAGLGFITMEQARRHGDLVEVLAPRPEWSAQLWLVTHVDLHRTVKVQSFLKYLKEEMKRIDTLYKAESWAG